MTAALTVSGLQAGYGGKPVLHGVDLTVTQGSALTIVGPNGSGKSTLLKAIAGLIPAQAGMIKMGEVDLTRMSAQARTRAGLVFVPQEGNVFRNMTVRENLRLGWDFHHHGPAGRLSPKLDEVLQLFPEIKPHLHTSAGFLSGGQRQMVAVASAMMLDPRVLVLDEPSAGLSPRNARLLFDIIDRIRQTGLTLLMIEQNVQLGLSVAEQGLVLVMGRVRHRAPASELAQDKSLAALFLGASGSHDAHSPDVF